MLITTLTSPIILRDYLCNDNNLKAMLTFNNGDTSELKIYPLHAPTEEETNEPRFTGEFITFSRQDYTEEEGGNINYKVSKMEVECFSPDYDKALFDMVANVEKVVRRMANDGFTIRVTGADEYMYAFKEGGKTWYCERIKIDIENVKATRED